MKNKAKKANCLLFCKPTVVPRFIGYGYLRMKARRIRTANGRKNFCINLEACAQSKNYCAERYKVHVHTYTYKLLPVTLRKAVCFISQLFYLLFFIRSQQPRRQFVKSKGNRQTQQCVMGHQMVSSLEDLLKYQKVKKVFLRA